ncbi:MAG: hypothetical protein JRG73_08230 [Deltaproteobacteria bacterium]|nr:hypothetical protein [Deltaproteobacteria bacterium]MBW2306907.1 hypothetical protein [Deltaproteobacteria bacterium]
MRYHILLMTPKELKAVRKRLEWLIIEWPRGQDTPSMYWLSDLPRNYGLVRYAKAHWRIEMDYRELKDELGLGHYEGRFWMGWNHHVTLTMMAHAFLTLERERQLLLSTWTGHCRICGQNYLMDTY